MRFIEDGPSIPDALLNARDDGRVVFFCGAGVSQAEAKLPNFFGLAESVLQDLRCPDNSDARKVLNKAKEVGDGLISVDRVFGLLERDFESIVIQRAVARCLAPKAGVNLSAHKLLLRLARTPASKTQLVTTNFDRLFQASDQNLRVHLPPRLPISSRYDDFNGLVYLHGCVNDDYTGPDVNGFVLSTSDFGYAYLSEGWAAEFFRDVVRRFVVVFIGYSADDPPINYLLEGLRRTHERSLGIYSFQSDDSNEAVARWNYKGAAAIPYNKAGAHRALWQTLEYWAVRADDPSAWRQKVVDLAMDGPEKLQPYQRGQVAHVVSTYEGAREFAERVPPAEWLCVFDPLCRYAGSRRSGYFDPDNAGTEPFALFSLDCDTAPEKDGAGDRSIPQSPIEDAWDAFALNSSDRQGLSDENLPALRGPRAMYAARLPKRIVCLSTWIAKTADQPASIWWAVRQSALHPTIYRNVEWELERRHENVHPIILKAWRYLLEAQKRIEHDPQRGALELKREIEREGWSAAVLRQFAAIGRPNLNADPALTSKPTPPKLNGNLRLWDLIRLKIECPIPTHDIAVPDEWLEKAIRELRKNIDFAVRLCDEVGDTSHLHISPIVPDASPDISRFARTEGLSGYVLAFASLFERLVELDVAKAKSEFSSWPNDDDTVFSRLRLWAAGKPLLATPVQFCYVIIGLSDTAFWSHDHQRDLLLVLAERWDDLPDALRKQIEARLLEGPPLGRRS